MALIRTVIFTLLVPGSVTVGVPYLLLSSREGLFPFELGIFRLLGVIPILLGFACYLWCAWDFAFAGQGTPGPWDAPRLFVSRGLYRIVRNPMYLGVVIILLGESVVFESLRLLVYAVVVWGCFFLMVVGYEEPTLKARFGATYEEYFRVVPRWIPHKRRAQRKG